MPMKASKRKARQESCQDSDKSPGTSYQRTGTEKSSLTDEQLSEVTQQIECKKATKVEDEILTTENTTLRDLGSL